MYWFRSCWHKRRDHNVLRDRILCTVLSTKVQAPIFREVELSRIRCYGCKYHVPCLVFGHFIPAISALDMYKFAGSPSFAHRACDFFTGKCCADTEFPGWHTDPHLHTHLRSAGR